jgi:hypothetical protein
MKKRGSVALSYEVLAKILGLREGLAVIGAKADPGNESIEFFISGEELHPVGRSERIRRYPLGELRDWELR